MTEDLRLAIQKNVPKNFKVVIIEHDKKLSNDLLQQDTLFVLPLTSTISTTRQRLITFSVYTKGSVIDDRIVNLFLNFCTLSATQGEVSLKKAGDDKGLLTYISSYQILLTLPSFTNSYKINSAEFNFNRK